MNKASNFNIFRVMNERTFVIIEVKLDVAPDITAGSKTQPISIVFGSKI